jgi:histidyl-tRNA synthetase
MTDAPPVAVARPSVGFVFRAEADAASTFNLDRVSATLGLVVDGIPLNTLGSTALFTGQTVPATGFSIGVSRLLSVLKARKGGETFITAPLIVVLVLDKTAVAESFRLARELRDAGFRAEAYAGEAGMKAQLRYADKRGAAIAVIEGGDERARGEVTLKDLALGAELAKATETRAAWVKDRPAQQSVPRTKLIDSVRAMLAARGG